MAVAERALTSLPTAEMPFPYRWTRKQFYEMGEAGLFVGQQVELIEGEILLMPPISPTHRAIVTIVGDLLRDVFEDGYFVSSQSPFEAGTSSDPEPDVAVIPGKPRDYLLTHPSNAVLIVEISQTTLAHDRNRKASLYAWTGVQDYWIVNLKSRQVEIHRRPLPEPEQPFGFGYAEITTWKSGETIQPLAKPEASIAVADLLP